MLVVSGGTSGRRRVVSLTGQRRLYCDAQLLLSGCTSVSASDEFLVVTTLEHTLLCLPLSALLSDGQWTQVEG